MQIDIETYISKGFEFPSAAREGDRVVAIAISDFERLRARAARQRDGRARDARRAGAHHRPSATPTLSRGTTCSASISSIWRRARGVIGVKLALGRDGGVMRARSVASADRRAHDRVPRATIFYGRNIVDTWILAQHYDIASRELEGFGLQASSRAFRLVTRKGRVYLDASRVSDIIRPRSASAVSSMRSTTCARPATLAEVLSPSYFVQAQIFPYSYQNVDPARERDQDRRAADARVPGRAATRFPAGSDPRALAGGYTEMRRCGVARSVAALRRHLAVSLADAPIRARARLRPRWACF